MRINNSVQKNERISKKVSLLSEKEKEEFLKSTPYDKIDKNDRLTHKHISRILEKRTYFRLEISKEAEEYNTKSVNYSCDDARFSQQLVRLCILKLFSFVDEFQVKELPTEEIVSQMIDIRNQNRLKKLPKKDMLKCYEHLMKYRSFRELEKVGLYSRASLYRYRSRFKDIGITETSMNPDQEGKIPVAKVNLQGYHSFLTFDFDLLRGIKH